MNKKFGIIKNIQLVLYIIFAGVAIGFFVMDSNIASAIASNDGFYVVAVAFWVLIAVGFVFIFIDLTMFANSSKSIKEMYSSFYSDKVARINNRISVDAYIEGFKGKDIPEGMCCILFALHSLEITNVKHDRDRGDTHVKAFSDILGLAGLEGAFVGRNGGRDFLVFFDDIDEDGLKEFFVRIKDLVLNHNETYDDSWIRYKFGVAHNKDHHFTNVGDLIHTAYEKCKDSEIVPNPEGKYE